MENIKFYKQYQNNYLLKGTAHIDEKHTPFTADEIKKIYNYCDKVEKEFVTVGDADEPNHVHVGRFMTDVKKPEIVQNEYSEDIIKILGSEKIKSFIKFIVNTNDKIYLRRIQYNEILKNCFVGYHFDIDSNPDYLAACVIQLGGEYEGGLYRVYNKDNKELYIDYKTYFGSFVISDCRFPHEVTNVTEGKRGSLVFFVSKENGSNKRKN